MQGHGRGKAWRGDCLAVAVCVLIGVSLSVLPHLIWWPEVGAPVWIADNDDLLYQSYAGQAYDNHPDRLGDPVLATGGSGMYPWLQLVPGVLLAKALGLGPMAVSLIWRTWAGLSIALAWYLVIRQYVRGPFWAAVVVAGLLADVGQLTGHLLIKQFLILDQALSGQCSALLTGKPDIHSQWRIITPGLSLMFLLLYVWSLSWARRNPNWTRVACAGTAFGLLFYVYFYYWTAAGFGLALALVLDAGYRKIYFYAGSIGGLIGIPALINGFLFKHSNSPDWSLRNDYFLPIPRFGELLIPKLAIILLVIGLVWIWMRRKDLLFLWGLAAAGLILANHQILTGLQINNFHWSYVWGPAISLLLVLLVVGAVRGRRWPKPAAWAAVVLAASHLAAGFWLRALEATQTTECVEFTRNYQKYSSQRRDTAVVSLVPNAVVAGDKNFVDLAVILENQRPLYHYAADISPSVTDGEWNTRIALNGFLRGLDRAAFAAEQKREVAAWVLGPWPRDPVKQAELLSGRMTCYDRVAANPGAFLDRFAVRYIALPAAQSTPVYLDLEWSCLEAGPYWAIWERRLRKPEGLPGRTI